MAQATREAQALADEHGLDLEDITGEGGWIRLEHVEAALAERAPEEPEEPEPAMVTIALAERAPFRAVDLPGCDPSIVLHRGEAARVPASVEALLRKAVGAGAIDSRVFDYLTIGDLKSPE